MAEDVNFRGLTDGAIARARGLAQTVSRGLDRVIADAETRAEDMKSESIKEAIGADQVELEGLIPEIQSGVDRRIVEIRAQASAVRSHIDIIVKDLTERYT